MGIKKRSKNKIILAAICSISIMSTSSVYAESLEGVVIKDDVKMHYTAGEEGTVTGILNINEKTQIEDVYDDWVLARLGNVSGWIRKNSVFVKNENNNMVSFGDVNATLLNVREGSGLNFPVVGQLANNDNIFILKIDGDWYYIKNDTIEGWVFSQYIGVTLQNKIGKRINSQENIEISRGEATKRSQKISTDDVTYTVEVLDYQNGKYYIKNSEGGYEWVDQSQIEIVIPPINAIGKSIVKIAQEYLGTPYVWGANGPNSFDCSGYTKFVFNRMGIQLPRVSRSQANVGQYVSRNDLILGDLVFFDTSSSKNGKISHVGIYMGSNQFIHASSSSSGKYVRISSLSDVFYNSRYVTARRVR